MNIMPLSKENFDSKEKIELGKFLIATDSLSTIGQWKSIIAEKSINEFV